MATHLTYHSCIAMISLQRHCVPWLYYIEMAHLLWYRPSAIQPIQAIKESCKWSLRTAVRVRDTTILGAIGSGSIVA